MTELETRLMDALAALSAQWDAEQQQHADEQDRLNVRINDLTQLVQDFAGQHEQQAAALQAQLQQLETQVGVCCSRAIASWRASCLSTRRCTWLDCHCVRPKLPTKMPGKTHSPTTRGRSQARNSSP